jgi:hypothetical protein
VGDVTGGLERTNGRAALEAGLGRVGDGQCRLWGSGQGGDVTGGRPVSETPGLRPRANWRCFETPLREAFDEAGIWAGLLTRLVGDPARGYLAHRSFFVNFFP